MKCPTLHSPPGQTLTMPLATRFNAPSSTQQIVQRVKPCWKPWAKAVVSFPPARKSSRPLFVCLAYKGRNPKVLCGLTVSKHNTLFLPSGRGSDAPIGIPGQPDSHLKRRLKRRFCCQKLTHSRQTSAVNRASGKTRSTLPSTSRSTRTRPPLARRPNSNSSASALRMVS